MVSPIPIGRNSKIFVSLKIGIPRISFNLRAIDFSVSRPAAIVLTSQQRSDVEDDEY